MLRQRLGILSLAGALSSFLRVLVFSSRARTLDQVAFFARLAFTVPNDLNFIQRLIGGPALLRNMYLPAFRALDM